MTWKITVVRSALFTGALFVSGCASSGMWEKIEKSRYAMDDEVYAEKYAEGAEKGDLLGKAKQMLDARHADGLKGVYAGVGTQLRDDETDNIFISGELGYETYLESWFSLRGGLAGFIGEDDWFAGLDLGARVQVPSRISPFAGVGTFNGLSTTYKDVSNDGRDNDGDGTIDERGERVVRADGWLSTIYPELGVHLWLTGHTRITAHGRYLVTTEGRDEDDWFYGLQLSTFHR